MENSRWHEIAQDFIHLTEQVSDGFSRLVTHVGNAECFSFDLPVSPINREFFLLPEGIDKTCDVDIQVVFHASQGLGCKLFFGKKLESFFVNPIADHLIEFGMPIVPGFHSLLENLLQGMVEPVNERDDGCAWGHSFLVVLAELQEIKVVSSPLDFLGSPECPLGNGEKG